MRQAGGRYTKNTLDFLVIGAQKAGTTSVFEYLGRHPEICLPVDKEAPYFSHDGIWAGGWQTYMGGTFGSADPRCKWGTVTPHYMVGGVYDAVGGREAARSHYDEHTVPLRIREQVPNVRLVAILRDPVERARSHHRMSVMRGLESRSFDEAVDVLLRPDRLEHSRRQPEESTGYITWGEYGRVLEGYFDVFRPNQILVMFTCELNLHPERFLARLHEFVGVSADIIPDNLGKRYREGASRRRVAWLRPDGVQDAVARNRVIRGIWHTLPRKTRRRVDRGFAQVSYRLNQWNRRKVTCEEEPSETTVSRLREHYGGDTERLAKILGRELPWPP